MKNNKLKNRLRFWLYLVLIILLYGSFLTYFCMAKPFEPNNIVIEQEKTTGQDTSTVKTFGPEFYLSEITSFYERIITILSIIIFLILGLNFLYIHRSSRSQSEEMAVEAIESKSFQIRLKNMMAKEANEFANEFIDIYAKIPELEERIEFLEEQANIQGYELSDESSDEVNDEGSDEVIDESSDEVIDGNN